MKYEKIAISKTDANVIYRVIDSLKDIAIVKNIHGKEFIISLGEYEIRCIHHPMYGKYVQVAHEKPHLLLDEHPSNSCRVVKWGFEQHFFLGNSYEVVCYDKWEPIQKPTKQFEEEP